VRESSQPVVVRVWWA